MSTLTAALPRLRFRKPKFPSGRRILALLWMGYGLGSVAHIGIDLAQDVDTFVLVVSCAVLVFWAWMFHVWKRYMHQIERLEKRGLVIPVSRVEWAVILWAYATLVFVWVI